MLAQEEEGEVLKPASLSGAAAGGGDDDDVPFDAAERISRVLASQTDAVNVGPSTVRSRRLAGSADALIRQITQATSYASLYQASARLLFHYVLKNLEPFTKTRFSIPATLERAPKVLRDRCPKCHGGSRDCSLCAHVASLLASMHGAGIYVTDSNFNENRESAEAIAEMVYTTYQRTQSATALFYSSSAAASTASSSASSFSATGDTKKNLRIAAAFAPKVASRSLASRVSRPVSASSVNSASKLPAPSAATTAATASEPLRPLRQQQQRAIAAFNVPPPEALIGTTYANSRARDATLLNIEAELANTVFDLSSAFVKENAFMKQHHVTKKALPSRLDVEESLDAQRVRHAQRFLSTGDKRKPYLARPSATEQVPASSLSVPAPAAGTTTTGTSATAATTTVVAAVEPLVTGSSAPNKRRNMTELSKPPPIGELELKLEFEKISGQKLLFRVDANEVRAQVSASGRACPDEAVFRSAEADWYAYKISTFVRQGIPLKSKQTSTAVSSLSGEEKDRQKKKAESRWPGDDVEVKERYQKYRLAQNVFVESTISLSESVHALHAQHGEQWFTRIKKLCALNTVKPSPNLQAALDLGRCLQLAPNLRYLTESECNAAFLSSPKLCGHLLQHLTLFAKSDAGAFKCIWGSSSDATASATAATALA